MVATYLLPEIEMKVRAAAEADRRSISDWIRLLIERELEKGNK